MNIFSLIRGEIFGDQNFDFSNKKYNALDE